MVKTRLILFVVLAGAGVVGSGRLDELLPVDREDQVAAVIRRHRQLPLLEDEALAAAAMAREVGNRAAEIELLERATSSPDLGEVAEVELAEVLVDTEPDRALDLVRPTIARAATPQLREAAVGVAEKAIANGVTVDRRSDVEKVAARLPRSQRRRLQAAAADLTTAAGRRRLVGLVREKPGDRVALESARRLEALPDLTEAERWQIARSLYQHALYEQAASRLEALLGGNLASLPAWEVSYLRGRCAFRVDDWPVALHWYGRALSLTASRNNKAELEVHLARTLELMGRVDEAVEAARRAVVADTTDSRRLFLARLRLRTGRVDLAMAGISRIRSSSNRSRGQLLVALFHLGAGESDKALAVLPGVSRRPWRGPAHVVEAGLLARSGRAVDALERLEEVVGELAGFWVWQARQVMAGLPVEVTDRWRVQRHAGAEKAGAVGRRDLVRLAVLEPDPARFPDLRRLVAIQRPLQGPEPQRRGIASELWDLGLHRAAVRWNPGGFPTATPREAEWSASAFLETGNPARAIRTADAAWRSRGADIPPRMYSDSLVSTLYPLPDQEILLSAATAGGADPALVAGVAREESRWDPTVLSRVGARGLMQLMPRTAETVAARIGLPAPLPEDLFDPSLSSRVGGRRAWSADIGVRWRQCRCGGRLQCR